MGDYNGTVPTFLAGELPDADKFTEITNFMTASTAAMTAWTPTWTNLTVGSGTVVARYRRLGKHFMARVKFTFGSGSSVGTDPTFTMPSGMNLHSGYVVLVDPIGDVALADADATDLRGIVTVGLTAGTCRFFFYDSSSVAANVTSTSPFTWATGDTISARIWAELA